MFSVCFYFVIEQTNYFKEIISSILYSFVVNFFSLYIGEAINQFLNTNANDLVQEMRPAASQSIGRLFRKILNSAFGSIPMRQWLM